MPIPLRVYTILNSQISHSVLPSLQLEGLRTGFVSNADDLEEAAAGLKELLVNNMAMLTLNGSW